MINIENTQVITYGQNQTVTVYRDYSDTNKWYIVPEPVIPHDNNDLPEFSLVQYTGNNGQVSGTCSFQTELAVSPEALDAVHRTLGAGITIGQFDWQSVQVIFTFATATSSSLKLFATPSMYGANRASYIIHLPDQATVNAFANAFGPQGSAAGTFMLEYDVTALTTLPPATVTVDFNAATAYEYEKTVSETRNSWGDVTSRTVAIHEHLARSEAGTITVGPGNLAPALMQALEDWGNATLENDVNQAVANALKIIGANNSDHFSFSQVASFHQEFIEGQIVPWTITPRASIPAFTQEQWSKVHSTVSNQSLSVSFTVQNLDTNGVQSIDLVVHYPTQTTNNTYEFTPTSPGTWVFQAPGQVVSGQYNPQYSYQYTVHYTDGGQPYQSAELTSSDTAIYISANDLNILQVAFDAGNISFPGGTTGGMQVSTQNQVSYVLIDFFFVNQADGMLVQSDQKKLDGSTRTVTFSSRTRLPFTNSYQYRQTYVLTGGQQVVIDWQTGNGATAAGEKATVHTISLLSPFQTRTVHVVPLPPAGSKFDMIELSVTYTDDLNHVQEQNTWEIDDSNPATAWTFLAPANHNGQVIEFEGEYIIKGDQHDIQTAQTPKMFVNISSTQETFSVEIDPSQIEWTKGNFTQVVLDIYTKSSTGSKTNIGQIPPFTPTNTGKMLYDFLFTTGTTPTYFYAAEYWVKDQPKPTLIAEATVSGEGNLVLPGTAS